MSDNERHSKPVRGDLLPPLTEAQRAQQEAANTLLQYDRMVELIEESLKGKSFRLKPHIIQDLNRVSLQRLEEDAGRWRDVAMAIGQSSHVPPSPVEIPRHIDDLCDYVNDNWNNSSPLHLAAYVMWRVNWIHPFVDGNGRTTRAVSYLVVCSRLGFHIPGVTTIPELIARNKAPYYKALEAADEAAKHGIIDVSAMEELVGDHLAKQMQEALDRADAPGRKTQSQQQYEGQPYEAHGSPEHSQIASQPDKFSRNLGALFGGFTLFFIATLIILSILERPIPEGARWLVAILFALCSGLSAGFLGGHANVRGSIPLGKKHSVRFNAFGGVGVLILVLVLCKYLFL